MKDVFEAAQEARRKGSLKDEVRDRLLKAVKHFLRTELILQADPKDSVEQMKKRTDYFVDKIVRMKKAL